MMTQIRLVALVLGCFFLGQVKAEGLQDWGEPNNGIQIRALAVASGTDEQAPEFDVAKQVRDFDDPANVSFVVQFKNVSDKPIRLQGLRYGSSVSKSSQGKSVQSHFGPHLFSIRLQDEAGESITTVDGAPESDMQFILLSGGSAESLDPGDMTTMMIKPISWNLSLSSRMSAGEYGIRVTYHGPSKSAREKIKKHWPEHELVDVWSGEVNSAVESIRMTGVAEEMRPTLVWGKPKDGIRMAAEYRLYDTRAEVPEEYRDRVYPLGSRLKVRLHFQNTTKEAITFRSELWRQDDRIFLVNDESETRLSQSWYSGMPQQKTWTLEPKQIAVVDAIAISLDVEDESRTSSPIAVGPVIATKAGDYRIRHETSSGISSGTTIITVRDRKPSDDPGHGRKAVLQFKGPGGEIAEEGYVRVQSLSGERRTLFEGQLSSDSLSVPGWGGEALRIHVRIPGYEEKKFSDFQPKAKGTSTVSLIPSDAIVLKLVDQDGNPVEGAEVRDFVSTRKTAGGYPFPTKGINGPIHGVSDDMGVVLLDMVQKLTEKESDRKIYTFCIVAEGYAHRFAGPVEAGSDLGTIELSPVLTFEGKIEGTPKELRNFDATWDQPTPLVLGNGKTSSLYANSAKLETWWEGDSLGFRILSLRPGKLRIIGNFSPRPHQVKKVFNRREPTESDQVFEFEVIESRKDVILKPKD